MNEKTKQILDDSILNFIEYNIERKNSILEKQNNINYLFNNIFKDENNNLFLMPKGVL